MNNFTTSELYDALEEAIKEELKYTYSVSEEEAEKVIQINNFYRRFLNDSEHFDFFEAEELANLFYDTYNYIIKRTTEERNSKSSRVPRMPRRLRKSNLNKITSSTVSETTKGDSEDYKIKIVKNLQNNEFFVAIVRESQKFDSQETVKKTEKDLLAILEEKSNPPPHYEYHEGKVVLLGTAKINRD